MQWIVIAQLALQVLNLLTPEILAIIKAIEAQDGKPTPTQTAQLQSYAACHNNFAQGLQSLVNW
jgi:hypothetical protein